jgi:hypothetical protein
MRGEAEVPGASNLETNQTPIVREVQVYAGTFVAAMAVSFEKCSHHRYNWKEKD